MLILSIETSCDETAISIVEAQGDFPHAHYEIHGDALWSQIDIHREYGGVFPALAKREHAATIVPMLEKAIKEAKLQATDFTPTLDPDTELEVRKLLEREPGLADVLLTFHREHGSYHFDLIAVTSGPGLEPALWVGVNFAKALALLWETKIVPVNHMEGHILASIFDAERDNQLADIQFPAISLLVSGGHTELILMENWKSYEKIGQTRDDAVGEAYDKVARLLGLNYPGGPEVAARAKRARQQKLPPYATLPTPMLHTSDHDFSFSGLKTAVRYAIQDKNLTEDEIASMCRDFEEAVVTVLIKKTCAAIEDRGAKTLIVGGGVSANQYLKQKFEAKLLTDYPDVTSYFPRPGLSTDNSIMIALAGHSKTDSAISSKSTQTIRAQGNKSL